MATFNYDTATAYAVENDELEMLLKGEDKYFYEDRLTPGPVNEAKAILAIYRLSKENPGVKDSFEEILNRFGKGTINEIFLAIQYIVLHLSFKEENINEFDFDVSRILAVIGTYMRDMIKSSKVSSEEMETLKFYDSLLVEKGFNSLL